MIAWFPFVTVGWIAVVALYGIVTSRNLVNMTACLTVLQSATYLLFASIGYVRNAAPPILYDQPPPERTVDPLVQALCLTDIVVGAGVTAMLLALVLQIHQKTGTISTRALRNRRRR